MSTVDDVLNVAGADYDTTLKRFAGNKKILEKFFRKYPSDPSFAMLVTALNAKQFDDVEHAAHTLKGVSANLGLTAISELAAQIVNMVRSRQIDGIDAVFKKLEEKQNAVITTINSLS